MTDKWFENEKQNDNERKRFSFFADPHLAHYLLPNTQANASQKSKSQIRPT